MVVRLDFACCCSALLYGGLRESNQREITLHDTDLPSFKVLLEYIYTGLVNLSRLKVSCRYTGWFYAAALRTVPFLFLSPFKFSFSSKQCRNLFSLRIPGS